MNPAVGIIGKGLVLPVFGFTLGLGYFIKAWPDEAGSMTLQDSDSSRKKGQSNLQLQRHDIVDKITRHGLYQKLINDPNYEHSLQSHKIPPGHRAYHVGQGVLFGPDKLAIDPLILTNTKKHEVVIFYHLGKDLGNEKGKIHKGVLSLILDEALCYCGFPTLPSKRGVTAKLDIQFDKDIPADSTIVLKARVSEFKGRKCVIEGTLESLPTVYNSWINALWRPSQYAKAKCILVEPRWFKYIGWLNVF
ncbi:hypothetical protein HG537_0B04320 [Torulaspora globosa]|uniref:Thioesterase domain-containing protein n=1 Tax=Torulaspora globosa TaxID=48254 RepID=A0A7H9HMS9_9SACH|nr:hypothetical protein HG537_0B04320 [Torulaspora sp. CBS 2947]